MPRLRLCARALRRCVHLATIAACAGAGAGAQEPSRPASQQITITGTPKHDVEKSYRAMMRGVDHFSAARGAMAPDASLRFKLLPRKAGTSMDAVVLEVVGASFEQRVPIAVDHTFVLERDDRAMAEDAVVVAHRRQFSMTWRAEIHTPGLPPGTRRLGDLRLECEVGLEAGLVSNNGPIARLLDFLQPSKAYCDREDTRYLFFADRPIFGVTLVAGTRRETLPIDRLYAMASDDPGWRDDLPFCDCEVLVDRTYFLPLGDPTWPDETRVEFEYMEERP